MSSPRALIADTVPFSNVDGPGNRFVVFFQGCNFDCIACHNPSTIAVCTHSATRERSVDDLLVEIRRAAPFLSGITVSGGEATLQAPFVAALFAVIKGDPVLRRLTCFVDSNGSADAETWDRLLPVMDGAMIDLKCLDDDVHRALTGQSNRAVLESIRHLHSAGRLYEVRLLIVPGYNDDPELLARTARWLSEVDPHLRVVVIGFRSHGVRPHEPALHEQSAAQLAERAAIVARSGALDVVVV